MFVFLCNFAGRSSTDFGIRSKAKKWRTVTSDSIPSLVFRWESKAVVADPDELAAPEGSDAFAEWAMLTLDALNDIETLHITDIHSTISKKHDTKIGQQVARRNAGNPRSLVADREYDAKSFRDALRETGIRHCSNTES